MSKAGAISTRPANRRAQAGSHKLAREQERDPPAHRRADKDGAALANAVEHGASLFQPVADRGVQQIALGQPMARIVETEHRQAHALRPRGKRHGLGGCHVRQKARKPENGRAIAACRGGKTIGDAAAPAALAHFQELRFGCAHPKTLDHGPTDHIASRAAPRHRRQRAGDRRDRRGADPGRGESAGGHGGGPHGKRRDASGRRGHHAARGEQEPVHHPCQRQAPGATYHRARCRTRACAQPGAGLERLSCRAPNRASLRHHLSRRLWHVRTAQDRL